MGCSLRPGFILISIILISIILFSSISLAESDDKVDVIIKFRDPASFRANLMRKIDTMSLSLKEEEVDRARKIILAKFDRQFEVKREFKYSNAIAARISRSQSAQLKKTCRSLE